MRYCCYLLCNVLRYELTFALHHCYHANMEIYFVNENKTEKAILLLFSNHLCIYCQNTAQKYMKVINVALGKKLLWTGAEVFHYLLCSHRILGENCISGNCKQGLIREKDSLLYCGSELKCKNHSGQKVDPKHSLF